MEPESRHTHLHLLVTLITSLLLSPLAGAGEARVIGGDRVTAGTVTHISGEVTRSTPAQADPRIPIMYGDTLNMGEAVQVQASSSLELTLGLNARVRMGPESQTVLSDITLQPMERGERKIWTLRLTSGEMRIRVRRNLVTPTPVRVLAGRAAVEIFGADVVLTYGEGGLDAVCRMGGVVMMVVPVGNAVWGEGEAITLSAGERVRIDRAGRVRRESAGAGMVLANRMQFTVEQERNALPPPPKYKMELNAP